MGRSSGRPPLPAPGSKLLPQPRVDPKAKCPAHPFPEAELSPPMPCFDRVIFDLDGTLIDSAPDIGAALNILLSHYDRRTVAVEEVRQMVGDGAANLLRQAFARTGAPLPEDRVQPVLAEFL